MSGMCFWAPQLLFMWQLLWLLVQARPLPELALDPNLLTTTTLGLTEPWPQDQQNLAEEPSYTAGEVEFPSQKEVSALQPESSEEEEEEEPIEVPPKKDSTPPQVHFASAELSAGNEEATFLHPKPAQAQQPTPPAISVESLDLGLIITPRPMEEAAQPTTLQHTTVSPEIPEVTPPHPEPSEVLEEEEEEPIEVPPKKGSTIPQLHFASAELSAGNEEGPAQPPEIPEATLLHAKPAQAQQPTPPAIAVQPVDLGLIITPRPMEEAEQPTTLQHTTAPPEHPAVTPPHRESAQAQQQPAIQVTALMFIVNQHPLEEAGQLTALQQTTAPPENLEVTASHRESAQAGLPTTPPVTVQSVDLGLTITPQPMEEAGQLTTLQQTTAPPEHSEVALSYLGSVQSRQPTLPGDMEGTKSLQPEPSKLVPPTTEEKATMSVCKLCSCMYETLSCVAPDPKQKLRSVPVLQPSIDKDTFTILDLRGNAITSWVETIWNSYQNLEKLILNGNEITELKKNSFKGLLSLKYLDLSCNKIQFIERNVFENLPFLEHLDLSCNSLEKLSLGTFEAWHRMQFLEKIILNRNPLTTIEDPYLFKLPALKYLDLGATQVSLKTVETVIMKTRKLEKLILPSLLTCCLCQLKNDIEAVSETVKLDCETACVLNTPCDEDLSTAKAALLDAVRSHRESTSTELTIEPEKTSPETRDNLLSDLMSLLRKFLKEKQKVEVPNAEWETGHLKNKSIHSKNEKIKTELPPYLFNKNLIVALPISVAAAMLFFLFCLIVICHKLYKEERKGSSRGFLPVMGHNRSSPESEMEAGSVWSRRPLWLNDLYRPLTTIQKKSMAERLQDESSDEDESPDKMHQDEVRIDISEPAAEDTGEERES
ncbi:leucine-rich repeat-containing protein 37A3-like [Saccopteryx bilineata]|uniref:leucine-rich repeat-containing protein 37A3-like n=1 Tax=Saccopteryx bilineata TaxID=59482 RepID=UPI00338F3D05